MTTYKLKTFLFAGFLSITGITSAQEYTIDGLCYTIIETDGVKSAQVEQHPGYLQGSVTIPSTVKIEGVNYSVTSIAQLAFYHDELSSISLPNTIVKIGTEAFGDCKELTSVTLPSSLKIIEDGAFTGSGLYSITIPRSVTDIKGNIVGNCDYLETITVESGNSIYDSRNNCNAVIKKDDNKLIFGCKTTSIPDDVEIIGSNAFISCKELTEISFPSSLSTIEYNAFYGCSGLLYLDFPENLMIVGDEAFRNCIGLTNLYITKNMSLGNYVFRGCGGLQSISVSPENRSYDSRNGCNAIIETDYGRLILGCENTVIPNNVNTIYSYAFENCTGLTSIVIPNNVTDIKGHAFEGCASLSSVTLPSGVTSLSVSLFRDCSSLSQIIIPNGVKTIGGTVFSGCASLQSVSIPASVTKVQTGVFAYCESLTSIIVESGNTKYDSRNNCNAVIETATNTLVAGCMTTVIPETVTVIGSNAFEGCTNMTGINIPENVMEIGQYAFKKSGLTEINIPETVKTMNDYAFEECTSLISFSWPSSLTNIPRSCFSSCYSLKEISIPEGVTSIGNFAFGDCSGLKTVYLPSTLTSIGTNAFRLCDNINSVTVEMTTPPGIDDRTFTGRANATLFVPVGSLYAYQAADYWKEFGSIQELVPYINGDANGDKSITVADYIAIAHHIMGNPPANFNEKAADANGDGQINVADYIAVAHIIMNQNSSKPPKKASPLNK